VTLALPERLQRAINASGRDDLLAWANGLAEILVGVAEEWELTVGEPFTPGGQCAWVAPAVTSSGESFVLKLAWVHSEARDEAVGLRAWNGKGAVHLIRQHTVNSTTSALLIERCEPGWSLASTLPESERDPIIASVLQKLWIRPAPELRLRPLSDMCAKWADEYAAQSPLVNSDLGLRRMSLDLLRSLPNDPTPQCVLVTDLHADNVLAAARQPWLAIDPKPYVGDPAYDVVQHIGTSYTRVQLDPDGLVNRMSDLAGVEADRVRLWLFARCMQESAGQPWLYEVAKKVAP